MTPEEQYVVEKWRRIYYQDIVYKVCNEIDRMEYGQPARRIVCGTFEEPNKNVQEAVSKLFLELAEWRRLGETPERAIQDARAEEREACARIAEDHYGSDPWAVTYRLAGETIAEAIRARGETT